MYLLQLYEMKSKQDTQLKLTLNCLFHMEQELESNR